MTPSNYSFLGQQTKGARVLFYSCEDDTDEMHRRQLAINKKLGIHNPRVQLPHFHMQSRVGKDNLLMTFDKGIGTATPFYARIVEDIRQTGAQVLILDNAAQLFGGNENDRREVTQFVNFLHRLAEESGVTIILLGHPAKGEASQYSGSTAWENCFRARLFLARPKQEDAIHDPNLADMRSLHRSKPNYSRLGGEVQFRWSEGAFEVVSGKVYNAADTFALRVREKQAQEDFLKMLDKLTAQGRNVSHSLQAKNYAPKVMAATKGCAHSIKQLTEAMEGLLAEDAIVANAPIGMRGNRSKITGLARVKKDAVSRQDDDCTEVHAGDL